MARDTAAASRASRGRPLVSRRRRDQQHPALLRPRGRTGRIRRRSAGARAWNEVFVLELRIRACRARSRAGRRAAVCGRPRRVCLHAAAHELDTSGRCARHHSESRPRVRAGRRRRDAKRALPGHQRALAGRRPRVDGVRSGQVRCGHADAAATILPEPDVDAPGDTRWSVDRLRARLVHRAVRTQTARHARRRAVRIRVRCTLPA
jgi:hypothetical protein